MTTALFEAPAHWRRATLAEVCSAGGGDIQTGPFGSQLHASDYVQHGIPSVMPQNIGDNVIHPEGIARITSEDARRLTRYLLSEGDIVYSRRGDVERRALVRANQDGWLCGTGCLRIRPGTAVDSGYLSYYLGHPEVRRWIVRHAVGATMLNLNSRILGEVPVLVPPQAVQESIVALLGAIDGKVAVNHRIAECSLTLADAHFSRAVEGIPTGPETFGSIAQVGGGGTPSTKNSEYWDGNIAWTTPSDVTALGAPYLFGTRRRITEAGLDNCASPLYPAGSIFMTSRATIGAFAIPQVPMAVNQGFIVVVPPDEEHTMWLFHEMRDRVDEMRSLANGSTFLELSRKNFKAMPARLPTRVALKEFARKVIPLHQMAAAATAESATLISLRDTLLPELLSGRLQVRDAEKVVEEAA